MDTSEIHYITYDPEEIYKEMQYAYIANGGDVLYPGDEKEILLRAVQSVMVQAFSAVDNALRMSTLRYATGEHLDLYGQNRGCYRIEAQAATATVEIKFRATGTSGAIPAGTAVTADGEHLYALDEEVAQTGYQQTSRVNVTAMNTGSAGNGLLAGTQMQFLIPQDAIESVFCVADAQGGQEQEDDETYRDRIRSFGLVNITTGPKMQYEAAAKNVTSEILDARAANLGAGKVGVALLLASDTGAAAIIRNVQEALNAKEVRPMTDEVRVYLAEKIPYTLNVMYRTEPGSGASTAIATAVTDYQKWQDSTIGRAFNPDRLMAAIYQAGADRVVWGEGSNFNGREVAYAEIPENAHCKGTITLGVIA